MAAMARRHKRLMFIAAAGVGLAAAVGVTLVALQDQVVYFFPPSEVAAKAEPGQRVRLGGLVEAGSVRREADGVFRFRVADPAGAIEVRYAGEPPDLFRENQGVVAEGMIAADGAFAADRLLAKHDETYMPREVAEALKQSGEWRGPEKPEALEAPPKSPAEPGA